jgi:hypothetical protein
MSAVGLVLHPTRPADPSMDTIMAAARRHPARLLARETDRHRVPAGVEVVPDTRFAAEVDALIALGGDGTILGAMRLVISRPRPRPRARRQPRQPRLPRRGAPGATARGAGAPGRRRFRHRAARGASGGRRCHGTGDALTAVMRPDAGQIVRLSPGEHASRSRIKLSLFDLPLRPDQLLELIPPELRRKVEAE